MSEGYRYNEGAGGNTLKVKEGAFVGENPEMIAKSGPSACQSVAKEWFKKREQKKRNDSRKTEEYAESAGERSSSTHQYEGAKTNEGKKPKRAEPIKESGARDVMISYSWKKKQGNS